MKNLIVLVVLIEFVVGVSPSFFNVVLGVYPNNQYLGLSMMNRE